ncbi:hypothetical protein BDB00DRAFT_786848 [Zychaea mexicana]|uniref:uncharacterized protein n=1 Tax=Zychaea mexicana TaxID=64656 RepID=UPI0022FEBADF|nr:uncharacterized protein BDB00DRAFT_786848 [Zychaea mexicana]KAI9494725.1 hypothetical protein BDB00DRAFT_786848 [Zychaea mexicana]
MTDPNPTDAGIITVGEERWIPGSRRADGSYRPARKVRAGFTPLEDVQRYASPQARQQAEQEQQRHLLQSREEEQKRQKPIKEARPHTQPAATNTTSVEERKIRNVQKKIRQVEELEQKLIKGETLNDDQREKVKKGKALRDELAKLTASAS